MSRGKSLIHDGGGQGTSAASVPADGAALVGRKISKNFEGHGRFVGKITAYDPRRQVFTISYNDGDLEVIPLIDIQNHLLKCGRSDEASRKRTSRPYEDVTSSPLAMAMRPVPPGSFSGHPSPLMAPSMHMPTYGYHSPTMPYINSSEPPPSWRRATTRPGWAPRAKVDFVGVVLPTLERLGWRIESTDSGSFFMPPVAAGSFEGETGGGRMYLTSEEEVLDYISQDPALAALCRVDYIPRRDSAYNWSSRNMGSRPEGRNAFAGGKNIERKDGRANGDAEWAQPSAKFHSPPHFVPVSSGPPTKLRKRDDFGRADEAGSVQYNIKRDPYSNAPFAMPSYYGASRGDYGHPRGGPGLAPKAAASQFAAPPPGGIPLSTNGTQASPYHYNPAAEHVKYRGGASLAGESLGSPRLNGRDSAIAFDGRLPSIQPLVSGKSTGASNGSRDTTNSLLPMSKLINSAPVISKMQRSQDWASSRVHSSEKYAVSTTVASMPLARESGYVSSLTNGEEGSGKKDVTYNPSGVAVPKVFESRPNGSLSAAVSATRQHEDWPFGRPPLQTMAASAASFQPPRSIVGAPSRGYSMQEIASAAQSGSVSTSASFRDSAQTKYAGHFSTLESQRGGVSYRAPTGYAGELISASREDSRKIRSMLVRFFEYYHRKRISEVDLIMREHTGDWSLLFDRLRETYCPESGNVWESIEAAVVGEAASYDERLSK